MIKELSMYRDIRNALFTRLWIYKRRIRSERTPSIIRSLILNSPSHILMHSPSSQLKLSCTWKTSFVLVALSPCPREKEPEIGARYVRSLARLLCLVAGITPSMSMAYKPRIVANSPSPQSLLPVVPFMKKSTSLRTSSIFSVKSSVVRFM